jgi:acyl-CoA hydrolase
LENKYSKFGAKIFAAFPEKIIDTLIFHYKCNNIKNTNYLSIPIMLKDNEKPTYYTDVETCVENTLSKVGKHIVLGIPIGLGKPNQLVNEFFRRALKDPSLQLSIFTALTLARPQWNNELERRLVEPLSARIFGNYPEINYVSALKENKLPANIEISEFYFQPGKFLHSNHAQQHHISSNYTHVVRDALINGVNVFAQLISNANQIGKKTYYSLSCNSDITPDLIPKMRAQEREGKKISILGQVNPELPFMYGDALVSPESFDAIVDHPQYAFKLFAPPNTAVSPADYMIGLYASALVKDGGTIQLGIGSLNDAVTYLINLRHTHNTIYRSLLSELNILNKFSEATNIGGMDLFKEGLFAVSEMLVNGFMELYRSGVLNRKAYPRRDIQRLLNEKKISERVSPETLLNLVEEKIIHPNLTQKDITLLQELGIFRAELEYNKGFIYLDNGMEIPADLADTHAAEKIYHFCLGSHLKGGNLLHASFFLGSQNFYRFLRDLGTREREQFSMRKISYVNELYGDEELKRLQRKDARFLNSALMVTLNGAIISDKIEDGKTVSGVGGQYNFIAMAHALADARAIIMLRSVREKHGNTHSNIIFNYGHTTIPDHLRDIVVTEYGIADLRGKNDREIIAALLNIADSRFQDSLLKEAKRAGKLSKNYQIPDEFKKNYPEHFKKYLNSYKAQNLFPEFPFGTELSQEEIVLMKALGLLQSIVIKKRLSIPNKKQIKMIITKPEIAIPYLKRLDLDKPKTVKEKLMQKLVLYGLSEIGEI